MTSGVASREAAQAVDLTETERERYSRQILFAGIGETGQQRLGRARVVLVGVGATGAAAAGLLARAGVGHLTLIDRDFVEPSNLQRQVLFDEADAREALPKAVAAGRKLQAANGGIAIHAEVADLTSGTVRLLEGADLVLDCTDNFETRFLLNEWAVREGVPWIYSAAVGAYAATMNILPAERDGAERTACLACLFPEPPGGPTETCDTAGILGPAVNLAASLATGEALKVLTGQATLMRRTLFSMDLWTGETAEVRAGTPAGACTVCGERAFPRLAGEGRPQITLCGRNSVQIHEHHRPVDLEALARRLEPLGRVRSNGLLVRFERGTHTLTVFPDGRALVQGTTDVGLARSLYARFVGS